MTVRILNELIQKFRNEAPSLYENYELENQEEFEEILDLLDYIMNFARKNKSELIDIDYTEKRKKTKLKPKVPPIFIKEMKKHFQIN